MSSRPLLLTVTGLALSAAVACGGHNQAPVAHPTAPPPTNTAGSPAGSGAPAGSGGDTTAPTSTTIPSPPPTPTISSDAMSSDPYVNETPDVINQHSPLQPIFFATDSDQLDDAARKSIDDDAQILKKYPSWVITIEGHCDERGTAEYNLALGERRALSVKAYLQSLGLSADRFRTVSYGKEFPFDPGHAESSWSKNRRAHLMVTSK
jgi:peptidoglycan-associated lipoprotein